MEGTDHSLLVHSVTLAFDEVDDMAAVLKHLHLPSGIQFVPQMLGIGRVGIGGSVLAGQDLANYTLPSVAPPGDSPR